MKLKNLENTNSETVKANVEDIKFFGDPNLFKLISKASSNEEGWMKSTKALDVGAGVVIQVTTQQRNPDYTNAIAEALVYVPGVTLVGEGDAIKIEPRPFADSIGNMVGAIKSYMEEK